MDHMYTGNILILDLTTGATTERELTDELVGARIGGAALNLSLYEEFKEKDPVIVGAGLLTGSMVPGSSLGVVTARSPISGKVMHSPLVNFLGTELKLAGFPFIVLHGRSERPSYLWLHDEIADLLPAEKVWGQDTWHTVDFIRDEQGEERIQVLSIGRAGENGGTGATAVVDYWSEGDKIGIGKRLGEMNLKALAARGMGELEVQDADRTMDLCMRMMRDARSKLSGARGIGSLLPKEDLKDLSTVKHRDIACSGCPWPCRTFAKYNEPPTVLKEELKEPGVLIVDASGFVALLKRGYGAADSARLLETCSRLGLEPVAASQEVGGTAYEDAKARLEELSSTAFNVPSPPRIEGAVCPGTFSPFAPNGGEAEDIALAYILGICPRYAARVGMDASVLSEMVEATTGLSRGADELLNLANSLIR